MKVGDLIIVTSFTPEIVPEKLGIYIDDGVTNGAHENCLVLTLEFMHCTILVLLIG